jgi:hypothetical protein
MIDRRSDTSHARVVLARGLGLAVLTLVLARPATAQDWVLGAGFAISVPQGDFGQVVGEGYGASGHVVYRPYPGVLGLRMDAAFITYGSERLFVPGFPSPRVGYDVRTHNNIVMFSIGPQLTLPAGPIEPYINGFVGLGYFFTESSLDGGDPFYPTIARTTNFDDTSLAYGFGGGLGIALTQGRRPVRLLFDAQYRHHDTTQYLREGSIVEDDFGNVHITFFESDADLILLKFGVSFTL